MITNFKPYSNNVLPNGFMYPFEYLELSKDLNKINSIPFFPWWFEDCDDSELKLYIQALEHFTGIDNLISFARDGDWAACFSLLDHSGDPKVYVFDLGNKENHYEVNNFNEWLNMMIEKSLR